MRPGAPPQSRRYVYTGPGGVSSLVTDPPGTPVTPCTNIYYYIMTAGSSLKFYVCSDVPHTGCENANGMKVRMTRHEGEMKWRWDESYLTGTQRGGTHKKRERENTNTNTPGPERANPEKAREKKKRRPTETDKDQRRGGEDGRAWTNLPRRDLSLPKHARTQTYLERGARMK